MRDFSNDLGLVGFMSRRRVGMHLLEAVRP